MSKLIDSPVVADIQIVERKEKGKTRWNLMLDGKLVHIFYDVDTSLIVPKVHSTQIDLQTICQSINIHFIQKFNITEKVLKQLIEETCTKAGTVYDMPNQSTIDQAQRILKREF